jgi:hypothetical protein
VGDSCHRSDNSGDVRNLPATESVNEDGRSFNVSELTTKPIGNGEALPLPRRTPSGLIPRSWLGSTLKLDFIGPDGTAATTSGAYVEQHGFGPVLKSALGDKFCLSWDRLVQVQLVED